MSYILDALKKSDQERRKGAVPDVHVEQCMPFSRSRAASFWAVLLVIILAVHAGILTWWLHHPSEPSPSATEQTALPMQPKSDSSNQPATLSLNPPASIPSELGLQQPAPVVPKPKTDALQAPSPKTSPGETKVEAQRSTAGTAREPASKEVLKKTTVRRPFPMGDREPLPPSGSGGQSSTKAKPAPDEGTHQLIGELQRPAGDVGYPSIAVHPSGTSVNPKNDGSGFSVSESGKMILGHPAVGFPAKDGNASSTIDDFSRESLPPPGRKPLPREEREREGKESEIPDLRQMPVSFQRQVPSMSFSMLVYAENPTDRMIGINGRVVREGDEIVAGLTLERIQPDSAVFRFKGRRFQKGIF
ncbi:MAG: GspB domain-containing protein [Deltaproteobacteria bacterium]|nr:GspB domain-containing protein [Deltaproteobacteria bacterium]